jgi:multidrug efflux pump subunit AcrA (membrane-fusion protein)
MSEKTRVGAIPTEIHRLPDEGAPVRDDARKHGSQGESPLDRTTRWTRMSARTKGLLVGGTLLVLLLAMAAVATFGRGDEPNMGAEEASADGMAGMQRMAGMHVNGGSTVQLTADQIRQFGVTFGSVEQRTLTDEVRTVGIVSFDETRMARIAPKFSGYIERLYVDFTGQPVRRGQALAEIYSPELVAAQEELLLAARLDRSLGESAVPGVPAGSPDLLAAARRRLRLWDISEAQIDQILRSGQVRHTLTLYAPVAGVVTEKNVLRGQAVQAGENLYTLADLSEVWVEAELREGDAGSVQEGSAATVELNAFPGRPIQGRVEYVYPTLHEQARTLTARIALPNPDRRIKPGMYARVSFSTPGGTALTVPTSAVVNTGQRTLVFMDMGGGRLMPMDVETGRVSGDFTEVLSGLEPEQRVVTSAQFLLDSESNLAEVMKSMMGSMGTADMGDAGMSGGSMQGMDMGGSSAGGMEGMEMKGADAKGTKMPAGKE